jgi:multisubunit Na+/H+ antiporter MnhG subunit
MTTESNSPEPPVVSRGLNLSLWLAQGSLALSFVGGAVWKVTTPIEHLAQKMPWMGEVAPWLLYLTAFFDLLGGLGVLLPSLTRVRPSLTLSASLGCIALMLAAILFHLSRGEGADTPFNFVMLACAAFVYWGRRFRAPLSPRA